MQQLLVQTTDDLQAVIRSAPPGSQLVLTPGKYPGNYLVDKPLEITGDGSGGTVSLTAQTGSCLHIKEPRTIIWGLTLRATSDAVTLLDIETNSVAVDECQLRGGETTVRIHGSREMDEPSG